MISTDSRSFGIFIFGAIMILFESVSSNVHISETDKFELSECNSDNEIHFAIQFLTDEYPEEQSWKITNLESGAIEHESESYTEAFSLYKHTFCFRSDACHKFQFIDSYGDGMMTYQSIQVFNGEEILYGSDIEFTNEGGFSIVIGNNCTLLLSSTSPSQHPSHEPTITPSVVPTSRPTSRPSSRPSQSQIPTITSMPSPIPSPFLSTNPSSNSTAESGNFDFIHVDTYGRRYFPQRLPQTRHHPYPTIPNCTKNNVGCIESWNTYPLDRYLPEWVGKLYQTPPSCSQQQGLHKPRTCDDGIPKLSQEDLFTMQSNMKLSPIAASKITAEKAVSLNDQNKRTRSILVADLDNDGKLDIIAGNNNESTNQVIFNFQAFLAGSSNAVDLPGSSVMNTNTIAVGDVNNDGWMDIIVGNGGQQNQIYFNDGSGVFTEELIFDLPGSVESDTTSIVVVDVDNDGWLDIIVGNLYDVDQILYNNRTGEFFNEKFEIPGGLSVTSCITAGDVNKDGWIDIIIGKESGKNHVNLNDGSGQFLEKNIKTLPGGQENLRTTSIAAGDINNDGWLDVVVGDFYANSHVILNDAKGWFVEDPLNLQAEGQLSSKTSIALGDLNNDGWLDIFVGNYVENSLLHLNDGSGGFVAVVLDVRSEVTSVAIADMTGNGFADIIVGNDSGNHFIGNSNQNNQVFLNSRGGWFENEAFKIPGDASSTNSIAIGDLNNDGFLDLVVANDFNEGGNQILLNDGLGHFVGPSLQLPADDEEDTAEIGLGDFNNDGLLDIVVVAQSSRSQVLYNNVSSHFHQRREILNLLTDENNIASSVAVGDVNNDGWLDVLIGISSATVFNQVILNDGMGGFKEAMSLPSTGLTNTNAIVAGDINNDGRLDIVVGNIGSSNRIIINDGDSGVFETAAIELPGIDNTLSLALGDVNNDGWIDIILGNLFRANKVMINDGAGGFDNDILELPSTGNTITTSISLGDVNHDGWIDIVFGNDNKKNQVLLNDGDGRFIESKVFDLASGTTYTSSIALADVNHDGTLDVISENTIIPFNICTNGGAQLHPLSWCFKCPSSMGKSPDHYPTGCLECMPDFIQESGEGEACLQPCVNKMRVLGNDECESCDGGFYFDTTITRDPDDPTTWVDSSCKPCPKGHYSPSNFTALDKCLKCLPGTHQPYNGSSACINCPLGSFQINVGSDQCEKCDTGGYCNSAITIGGGYSPCPVGTYNDKEGQSSASACIPCPAGTFNPRYGGSDKESSCQACPSGTYNNQTGGNICFQCPEGTFQPDANQTQCLPCEVGTYTDNTGFKECIKCPYRLSSSENSTTCPFCDNGFYLHNTTDNSSVEIFQDPSKFCSNCPINTNCSRNTSIEMIQLQPNHWRLSNLTSRIYSCSLKSKACVGSREGVDGYCENGHTGPLCTVCEEVNRYFDERDKECIDCPRSFAIVLILIGVALFIVLLAYFLNKHCTNSIWIDSIERYGFIEKLKLLISFYQVLAVFDDVYGVRLSDRFTGWLSLLNILSLDVIQLLPLDCFISTKQQIATKALSPYLVILSGSLCIILFNLMRLSHGQIIPNPSHKRQAIKQRILQMAIIIIYFTLPVVVKGIFDAIRCRAFQFDDTNPPSMKSFLLVNMDIECNPSKTEYQHILILFGFLFALWIVLTPLFLLMLLQRLSVKIQANRICYVTHSIRFLWQDYISTAWYWDIVDIYRKIVLTGLIMFIDLANGSDGVLRLVVGNIVSALYLSVLLFIQPYRKKSNNYYALICNFFLVCCFGLGIILKLCEENGSTDNGRSNGSTCKRFVGTQLDSTAASTLVLCLALGLLVMSIGLVCFLSVNTITAPMVRLSSTKEKPNLELPYQYTHHVFVSHVWKTGQAKTHAIVRKLQLIMPRLKVWLDVDELSDISSLEECVGESAVFVLYYSKHYFASKNCQREVYAAIKSEKPMILVYEGNETVLDDLVDECIRHCEGNGCDIPGHNVILEKLFGEDNDQPILWLNEGIFSAAAMNQLCQRILNHMPHYRGKPSNELQIEVPGEMGQVHLQNPVNLLIYEKNIGCGEIAMELKQALCSTQTDLIEIMDAENHFCPAWMNEDANGENNDTHENLKMLQTTYDLSAAEEMKKPTFFMLYLNDNTFNLGERDTVKLVSLVRACIESNIGIILVHEKDVLKGGCEFENFFASAPNELLKSPISIFSEIAVPLYTKEEYRSVSLRQIYLKMGAMHFSDTRGLGQSFSRNSLFKSLTGGDK